MTKQEIAQKHGFIQGMSIHSNTSKIEECLYAAMEKYAQQQVKLSAIPDVGQQRELLLAYHKFYLKWRGSVTDSRAEYCVDAFLANNCD